MLALLNLINNKSKKILYLFKKKCYYNYTKNGVKKGVALLTQKERNEI